MTKGGSVYYGEIEAGKGNVLYHLVADATDPSGFRKEKIDISENIIKELTTNEKISELIKELTKETIKEGATTETGEVIGEYKVFKTIVTATVNTGKTSDGTDVDYNTEFNSAIGLEKFSRLLNVEILDKSGQILLTTVTDVAPGTIGTDGKTPVKFRFGVGKMYVPLESGKSYDVILKYVSNEKFVKPQP